MNWSSSNGVFPPQLWTGVLLITLYRILQDRALVVRLKL